MNSVFDAQKYGIWEALCGPDAFIPADGSVAIAVIEFFDGKDVEIPLTVVNEAGLAEVCDCVENTIEFHGGGTQANYGLAEAKRIFDEEAAGVQRFLVFSSDGGATDQTASKSTCEAMRTSPILVTICSVMVGVGDCSQVPHDPPNTYEDFMMDCANSDGRYPDEPIGGFGCAENATQYAGQVNECLRLCAIIHADGPDCNENGVPDECELGNDCNDNDVPDDCDIDPTDPDGDAL